MANIMFKKGSYSDFKTKVLEPKNIVDGALYLTEDEGSLYLGKVVDGVKSVKRIQGSVVFYEDDLTFIGEVVNQPPYSSDLIYFISQKNALVRWDAINSKWVQLNATVDEVTTQLNNLQIAVNAALEQTNTNKNNIQTINNVIGDTTKGLVKDIADAKKAGDDAQSDVDALEIIVNNGATGLAAAHTKAGNAQTKADQAYNLANDANELAKTKANAQDVANTYATKTEAEDWAKNYSEAVQGETDKTVQYAVEEIGKTNTEVGNVKTLAQNAKNTADAALSREGGTMTGDLTLKGAPTADLHAATKKYVDDTKSELTETINGVSERAEKGITDAAAAQTLASNNKIALDTKVNRNGDTLTGFLTLHADPTADKHAATKGYVDTQVQDAKDYAAGLVAGNDAMTFKGVLNATSSLPTAVNTSKRGDTYKVGVSGTYAGQPAKVGDLFINTAADDAVPVWEHISSGYEDDYLQKLVNNNGIIGITDGVNNDINNTRGTIQVVGNTASSVVVSTSSTNNAHTITVGMEWGSF